MPFSEWSSANVNDASSFSLHPSAFVLQPIFDPRASVFENKALLRLRRSRSTGPPPGGRGLPLGEGTRQTELFRIEPVTLLKALAWWERRRLRDILAEALESHLRRYTREELRKIVHDYVEGAY